MAMTKELAEEIRKTLNDSDVDIKPVDYVKVAPNKGEVHTEDADTATTIKWGVKPKVNFGKALAGDIQGAVGNTSLQLEFGREYKDQDVEVWIKVGGNLNNVLSSPAGTKNFSASFVATKRF